MSWNNRTSLSYYVLIERYLAEIPSMLLYFIRRNAVQFIQYEIVVTLLEAVKWPWDKCHKSVAKIGYYARDPFNKRYELITQAYANMCCSYANSNYSFMLAAVTCTKLWPDWLVERKIKDKRICTNMPLAKWIPGRCSVPLTRTHFHNEDKFVYE